MEWSDAFESDLEDLEDAAIQLATTGTNDRLECERRFAANLDHIVNTHPVECERVVTLEGGRPHLGDENPHNNRQQTH